MEYQCDICGEKIPGELLTFIQHSEKHIVDVIKNKHPHWAEKNGTCPKCLEYYKKELKGEN